MKKTTLVLFTATMFAFVYFSHATNVVASSNDGILTDTTKKEKKVTPKPKETTKETPKKQTSAVTDTTGSKK